MKSTLLAVVLASGFTSAAFAAEQTLSCSNASGFQVNVTANQDGGLGTLTYGMAGALTTVDGVDASLISGLGAAVKGTDVLFVVYPAGSKKLGELVVEGATYRVECK